MLINLGIVFILLLLNGFFAMSELALVSARHGRLSKMAQEGKTKRKRKGARLALDLANDQASFLSIVQIGVTLNSILAGAFSGAALAEPLGVFLNEIPHLAPHGQQIAFILTVTLVSYFSLVVGELVPKRIGLSYAEAIAVRVAWVMHFLAFLIAPAVWLLKLSTDFLLKLLGLNGAREADVTEDEVKDLIEEGTQSGAIMPAEKDMLDGVMRLSDRNVRRLMTPRIDLVWLSADASYEENRETILESGYSRLVLARGDLDEVVGIVYAKDVLGALMRNRKIDLEGLAHEALLIPDSTSVLRLLDQFKNSGQHLAVVIDEYGSVEGLVTLTDVLEAIVGDLPENGHEDDEKPVQQENGSWLFDGMTPIDEVEALIGMKNLCEGDDFHTLAGFMIDKLENLPVVDDSLLWNGVCFNVTEMEGRRIKQVAVVCRPVSGEKL
ncbi:MAG TPA: hypothetical protein DD400_03125 [Rhodospirillaceae bacterium]|nr:hypothetical protein [Rhodospirillaceae bacterium]